MPGGGTATRDYVRHVGAVAVVALDGAGQVLLMRQYRHPVGRPVAELPGRADGRRRARTCRHRRPGAGRGGRPHRRPAMATLLVDLHTSPGLPTRCVRVFLARGLAEVPPGSATSAARRSRPPDRSGRPGRGGADGAGREVTNGPSWRVAGRRPRPRRRSWSVHAPWRTLLSRAMPGCRAGVGEVPARPPRRPASDAGRGRAAPWQAAREPGRWRGMPTRRARADPGADMGGTAERQAGGAAHRQRPGHGLSLCRRARNGRPAPRLPPAEPVDRGGNGADRARGPYGAGRPRRKVSAS